METKHLCLNVLRLDKSVISMESISIDLHVNDNVEILKEKIQDELKITEDEEVFIKMKNKNGAFVPFSTILLPGETSEDYTLEVVKMNLSTKCHSARDVTCKFNNIMSSHIKDLKKRTLELEKLSQVYRSCYDFKIEGILYNMLAMVNFLDRRLDELTPVEWKNSV